MDGLSAAVNVLSVVDLALKAGSKILSYIDSAKGSTTVTRKLHEELTTVQLSLVNIDGIAKRLDSAAQAASPGATLDLSVTTRLLPILSNYQKTIEELLANLESHFGNKVRILI